MNEPTSIYPWGGGSKSPPPSGAQPGIPYRYVLEANALNVEIRLGSMNITLTPNNINEVQCAIAVFKQGGCLMVRDGKLSILPPPVLPGVTKPT